MAFVYIFSMHAACAVYNMAFFVKCFVHTPASVDQAAAVVLNSIRFDSKWIFLLDQNTAACECKICFGKMSAALGFLLFPHSCHTRCWRAFLSAFVGSLILFIPLILICIENSFRSTLECLCLNKATFVQKHEKN